MSTPHAARLTGLHARYQFTETVRIPIAVVGTTVFPTLSMLFFIVPLPAAQDPVAATAAAAQLSLFAVMNVCLFTYGAGVAQEREQPWDAYLRTLPAGPGPRLGGRLVTGLGFALLGLLPLVLVAWLLTAATLPPGRLALSAGALLLAALPMLAGGLAIGYALSAKAAMAVAQALLLPLSFGGGLFIPPAAFPDWLDAISRWLPTRAGRDLVVAATTADADLSPATVLVLLGWAVGTAGLAGWAYRRDEGRRFR